MSHTVNLVTNTVIDTDFRAVDSESHTTNRATDLVSRNIICVTDSEFHIISSYRYPRSHSRQSLSITHPYFESRSIQNSQEYEARCRRSDSVGFSGVQILATILQSGRGGGWAGSSHDSE